ncbi:DUF2778 domain-containing protein [Citrobacter braakii]|uniref:DUF2778 domain-containing protein n=1 Tax=Citrobacter braakii TaxID=57706 RepID=UPI000CDDB6B4|nr:DUF2778 domain-containing protein [Citrobacter braakii]EGT0619147.1 DUF2778 domain-containing protein [Citrobacter braakii]MBJ8847412.1 DUF2778 domain-containing protein [Citrobacter braakii]POT33710.1 hypothetical protein C3423_06335 [Citrobacter braakii]POT38539.1 hypothetical protein C3431_06335 [Citrobacter braakii]POT42610.1 hypothetical protein C3425_06335 [Citrobacter braakii]
MIRCTFHLNGGQLSNLSCPGVGFFPAYSGNSGEHRNNPESVAIKDIGPLPPGKYYIVSRPKGGIFSAIKDYTASEISGSDRDIWFGLFREDEKLDDVTFYNKVNRGYFRLHPAGYTGVSNGCITLPSRAHYNILREALLSTPQMLVTPSLRAYGTIQVY